MLFEEIAQSFLSTNKPPLQQNSFLSGELALQRGGRALDCCPWVIILQARIGEVVGFFVRDFFAVFLTYQYRIDSSGNKQLGTKMASNCTKRPQERSHYFL